MTRRGVYAAALVLAAAADVVAERLQVRDADAPTGVTETQLVGLHAIEPPQLQPEG